MAITPSSSGGMNRLLRILGLLALLAWTGAGLFFWLNVREKIVIELRPAGEESADDTILLLQDDVQQVRRDLNTLTRALEENMSKLVAALEEEMTSSSDALQQRITSLETKLVQARNRPSPHPETERLLAAAEALRVELGALREAVAHGGWSSRPAGAAGVDAGPRHVRQAVKSHDAAVGTSGRHPAARPVAVKPVEPAPDSRATPPPSDERAVTKRESPEPSVDEPLKAPVATAGRKRGFLSFKLPGRALGFDALQRFEIIPRLSRVGYDAQSTLHDFTGATQAVSGRFVLNPAYPESEASGNVRVHAGKIKTGNEDRDAGMYDLLHTREHPDIVFTIEGAEDVRTDAAARRSEGIVRGTLSIGGVGKPFSIPVTLSMDEGHRLLIKGEAPLKLSTFGIEAPSKMGFISMEDEVKVWVAIRARAMGKP